MMTGDQHFMMTSAVLEDYVPKTPKPLYPVPRGVHLFRIKKALMEKVLMGGSWDGVLPYGVRNLNDESIAGHSIILKTGAKAMHYGNGYWAFYGYHHSNKDVVDVLEELGIY